MNLSWVHMGRIGRRILLTFVSPLLVVILFLGYYVTVTTLEDTRYALNERGELLARHLAVLSEFGMFATDTSELEKYAMSILGEADVSFVTIEDREHKILVHQKAQGNRPDQENLIEFRAPIMRSSVEVSDYRDESTQAGIDIPSNIIGTVHVGVSRVSMRTQEAHIRFVGILATSIALLTSILLAFLVARRVSSPIIRLTGTVDQLTDGDLSARTEVDSPGELGTLERGINQMASTLEGAQARLVKDVEDATFELHKTVSKLEEKNQELVSARLAAMQAGEAKSEFLAKMSHEIRTPLSAIIGFAQLLESTADPEDQKENIQTIMHAASQLLVVIDDILSYTRLESGNIKPENTAFDLHKCLENIISIYRESAFEKGLELVLYIHTDVPTRIASDQNRINQILINLLTNAIKFTDSGHVVVEASLQATDSRQNIIRISVTDTGAGVGDNDKLQIFEPFVQADTSISRKYGGTGLGLSISKKLVQLLGGEINVRDAPDGGTCFWFTLVSPLTEDTGASAETPLTGTRILVYDQNSFVCRAIRNQFLKWGATVFIATDRERLLEMIESGNDAKTAYQLIVLGIPVKHCTNQTIQEQLDSVRHLSDASVLILAGSLMSNIDTAATNENVHILSKPPRSERMLRTARKLLFGDASPNRSVSEAAQTVDNTAAEHPGNAKILVAEDNVFNQKLLTTLISDLGHRMVMANNGEEACRYANETLFDIILMDIHMPVMGGIEATRVIRKGINRGTPIIALTADVFANKDEQLHASGIDDFLFKPVEKANLMALLDKWLARKSLSPENTAQLSGNAGAGKTMPPELRAELAEELALQLHHMQQACLADDPVSLDRHLHQLNGIVGYFSLTEFRDGFQKLEHVLAAGCREETLQAIDALDRLLQKSS